MSKNLKLHVFNDETLAEHDMRIAVAVHQATVKSDIRRASRMSPGQVLNASREHGRSLYWPKEKLEKLLKHIDED